MGPNEDKQITFLIPKYSMPVNNVNLIFKIWNGYNYCIVDRHFKQCYIYIMTNRELTGEKQNFGRLCLKLALLLDILGLENTSVMEDFGQRSTT